MPTSFRVVVGSTFVFLIVGLVALLAIVSTTFWLGERAQIYVTLTSQARDMRTAAVELRSAIQAAESGQRGYLLTGNEIYLSPYDVAKRSAQRQLAALQRLTTVFPEAAVPLARVSSLISQKFTELDDTIGLKRQRRDSEALAVMMTNKGKILTDETNVFLTGLIRLAEDHLTNVVDEQRANAGWLRVVSASGALVIILVVGGAAFMLLRHTQELRAARDALNTLNVALEQRVSERTAELTAARDRAELLLREVNHRVANSLALVSSFISLQSKGLSDAEAKRALMETQDRIFAVSLIHRKLYGPREIGIVSLDEYLSALLDHLNTSLRADVRRMTLSYTLEPIMLATDAGVNLGVVLTEWVTNAFKYAYPEGGGEVRVGLAKRTDDRVELSVEDDGVGRREGVPVKGTGLGSKIVTAMATSLGGTVEYQERSPGTRAVLVFPPAAS